MHKTYKKEVGVREVCTLDKVIHNLVENYWMTREGAESFVREHNTTVTRLMVEGKSSVEIAGHLYRPTIRTGPDSRILKETREMKRIKMLAD